MSPRLRPFAILLLLVAIGFFGWQLSRPSDAPAVKPPVTRASSRPAMPPSTPEAEAQPPAPVVEDIEFAPARSNFSSAWTHSSDPVFTAFQQWTERYLAATPAARADMLPEGLALAVQRRELMKELIKHDPRLAIASAVPMTIRAQLPPELLALLEERVAGQGSLALIGGTPVAGSTLAEPLFHSVMVNDKEYRAYVYGRRESQVKPDISILGVAVDRSLAVSESPLRVLEEGEAPTPGEEIVDVCPISGEVTPLAPNEPLITADSRAVQVGPKLYQLCNGNHAAILENQIIADESSGDTFTAADGAPGSSHVSGRPAQTWSTGTKKVLLILVDFSDFTGGPKDSAGNQPMTSAYAAGVFNTPNGIADFYSQGSFGKTALSITASDVTAVLRMPHTASYYANGDGTNSYDSTLHSDAQAAATTAGFNMNNYDRIGVIFDYMGSISGSKITYGGLGDVRGKKFWINGTLDFRTTSHEIGHNYGLQHCNLWQVSDGNPVSPSGSSTEYADPFGVMSSGSTDIRYHFDMWQKNILWWYPDSSVTTISSSGTYRVYRFDHASANTANPLALKIVRNGTQDYWIGLRKLFTTNAAANNGAYILWGYNSVVQGNLLDFNTTGTNPLDAPLAIGTSFYDTAATTPVSITPIARGGTSPNEYLDIRVNFGPFPGNVAPVASINGPSTASARQTCVFTAQATDADGDALAYTWDFGQGTVYDNNSSAAFAWNVGGTFTVKLTVTDMKGHNTVVTKSVTVTDPITTWTARTTTATGNLEALATNGTSVLAVGEDYGTFKGPTVISTDGVTWTTHLLGSNQQAYGATWDGSKWIAVGQDYNFTTSAWQGAVFTSPDAVTWTERYKAGSPLQAVTANGGTLVAVGDGGTIVRSTNGTTWAPVTSGTTNNLAGVAYGGGKFVAVGYAGGNGTCTVLTSTDGSTWTASNAGSALASWQDLRHIVWANDRFLSSGFYGKFRYSTDLATTFSTTRTTTEEMPAAAYGNGVWFAAGADEDTTDNVDLVSSDGVNWTSLATTASDTRHAGIFFKNTFITVGDNHSIRQSGAISAPANGYYTWRETNFPDHGANSVQNTDADGDGVPNLVEYALARSPLSGTGSNGVAALPKGSTANANSLLTGRLSLTCDLPEPAETDIIYTVEVSSTLTGSFTTLATKTGTGAWTWTAGGTSRIVAGTTSGGRATTTIGDTQLISAGPRRFLRLRTAINQ